MRGSIAWDQMPPGEDIYDDNDNDDDGSDDDGDGDKSIDHDNAIIIVRTYCRSLIARSLLRRLLRVFHGMYHENSHLSAAILC